MILLKVISPIPVPVETVGLLLTVTGLLKLIFWLLVVTLLFKFI
jgi:hypothetical protein